MAVKTVLMTADRLVAAKVMLMAVTKGILKAGRWAAWREPQKAGLLAVMSDAQKVGWRAWKSVNWRVAAKDGSLVYSKAVWMELWWVGTWVVYLVVW